MASSKRDFERFVAWLHQPENQAHADVRRLANVTLANFDRVAATSRNRSQRSIYLADQARRSWAEASGGPPDIQPIAVQAARLLGGTALLPVFAPGENAYPAGPDPVTPGLFREHQRTGAALSDGQLAALQRTKQFTDFNDLAKRSALGRDGIER